MKRGGPLKRGAPLARGDAPKRSAPLRARPPAATGAPTARALPKPRASAARGTDTGPTRATRDLVAARDLGRCVICGGPGANLQHRQRRGMGGRQGEAATRANAAEALILLCGSGTTGCHGWVTDHAPRDVVAELGWELPRSHPIPVARVPVWVAWRREWVVLSAERAIPVPLPPPPPETLAHVPIGR